MTIGTMYSREYRGFCTPSREDQCRAAEAYSHALGEAAYIDAEYSVVTVTDEEYDEIRQIESSVGEALSKCGEGTGG